MSRCRECGAVVPEEARFCPACGVTLASEPGLPSGEGATATPPAPALPPGEAKEAASPAATTASLPRPERGIVWSLLLTPLAGALAWANDYRRLGRIRRANATLVSGAAATLVALPLAVVWRGRVGALLSLAVVWGWTAVAYGLRRRDAPAAAGRPLHWAVVGLLAAVQAFGILGGGGPAPARRAVPATATPAAGGSAQGKGATVATELRTVSLVPLTAQRSPQGDYAVGRPQGWTSQPLRGMGNSLQLLPPGTTASTLGGINVIPGIPVSDIRFNTMLQRCTQAFSQNPLAAPDATTCTVQAGQAQLQDSSHPWSPQDALAAILQVFGRSVRFGTPQLTPISQQAAAFRVTETGRDGPATLWGFIDVLPVENALLSSGGRPGVTSVALLGTCSAPQGREASVQNACGQVLGSFQPSQAFWTNLSQELGQRYQQEEEVLLQMGETAVRGFSVRSKMVASWGASMQQLQAQTYEAIRAQSLKVGENAIATLGGETLEQDPATGKVYSLPFGYGAYCLTAAGDAAVMGAGVAPGKSGCATLLRPWQ